MTSINKDYILPFSIAFLCIISMLPYFTWQHQNFYFITSSLLVIASYSLTLLQTKPTKTSFFAAIIFSLFLIYLSLLFTVQHAHKHWFFLIPTIGILFCLTAEDKKKCFTYFSIAFAISLIPSIIIDFLMLAGMSINFSILQPYEPFKILHHSYYLYFPGAVYLHYVFEAFSFGGQIARLCGIYDEPGLVGTVAGLLLAATNFDFKKYWYNYLLLIGGVLSFSAAFYAISLIYLLLKRNFLKAGIFILLSSTLLIYYPIHSSNTRDTLHLSQDFLGQQHELVGLYDKVENRSSAQMNKLFISYLHGSYKTLVFGIASDANGVYGGDNSTWKSILTNYGIIGFLFILLFLALYPLYFNKNDNQKWHVFAFVCTFILSIYQRPFIWIPCYIIIYLGGILFNEPKTTAIQHKPQKL